MIENMTIKNTRFSAAIAEKSRLFAAFIRNSLKTHKDVLVRCAVVFLAVKLGLILLATVFATVFLMTTATRQISEELSRTQALLFSTPLTLIMLLKLYFLFRMLTAHGRSRRVLVTALQALSLKGRQGLRQIENSIPAALPRLSPEKAVKH